MNLLNKKIPLVLLHGWGVNAAIWNPILDRLMSYFDVTMIDLPGYGDDQSFHGEYSIEQVVDRILQDDRLPTNCPWVGWSLGGTIGIELAIRFPQKMSCLQLVSTTPRFLVTGDWPYGVELAPFHAIEKGFVENYERGLKKFLLMQMQFDSKLAPDRKFVRDLQNDLISRPIPTAKALKGSLNLLAELDLRERLHRMNMPVQVVLGTGDRVVPADASRWLAGQIPKLHSRLELPTGHLPFLQAADEYIDGLRSFVSDSHDT